MTNALKKKNYLKWNLIPWHAVPCFARFVRFNYKIWFLFTVFLIEAYWISIAFVMAEIACIVRSKLIPLCMLVHRLIALFFLLNERVYFFRFIDTTSIDCLFVAIFVTCSNIFLLQSLIWLRIAKSTFTLFRSILANVC